MAVIKEEFWHLVTFYWGVVSSEFIKLNFADIWRVLEGLSADIHPIWSEL